MKKRRILALALSAGMLIGQASYAYGTEVPNKTVKNETDITYDIENDTELSGDNGQSDTEQIEEFSEENITDNSQLMLSTFTYDEEDGNSVGENTGAAEENILTDAEVYSSPDDEVVIKDETLRNILINKYYYDEDLGRNVYFSEDGYISVKEMESLTELSIYGNVSISDLTGLEYAVNLEILEFNGIDLHGLTSIEPLRGLSKMRRLSLNETGLTDISALEGLTNLESLYLRNNTGIKDISPLAGLSSLHFLVLSGCSQLATIKPIYGLLNNSLSYLIISDTAVPAQERMDVFCEMELASLPSSLILGDSIRIYHIENYLNSTSEFYVSSVGGDSESINISDEGNCIEIAPQVTGDIVIQFSIDDVTLEYPISVEGFSTGDMTLGESVDYTVDYITQKNGWNTSTILISNGELWDLYPEATCKKKNVKSYVSDWIYSGSDAVLAEYVLDYDNVLWSDETRIADNIQKYDGHYALTTDNVLIDIYNDQSIRLEGVCDWIQEISTEYNESGEPLKSTTTYVLKQDGTLWSREEVEKSAAVNQFEKIADGVVQLFDDQYNDYYLADDGKYYYFNGTETSYSRNFDDDGNLCLGGQVIGKFNIKEFYDHFYYMYFLTEEGEFYRW